MTLSSIHAIGDCYTFGLEISFRYDAAATGQKFRNRERADPVQYAEPVADLLREYATISVQPMDHVGKLNSTHLVRVKLSTNPF